jgi:tRNA (adenine37-N6)-methyltransferase
MMQPKTRKLTLTPIGSIHTRYKDRASAPRQPGTAAESSVGEITLLPHHNFEQALHDLIGFERIWIVFWFHKNKGWNPKVLPPRSTKKKGVFATRSPHRPNPVGISVCRLLKVEGLRITVENPDLLDGTPILDIKPYVSAIEAFPDSRAGWLDDEKVESPGQYEVEVEPDASEKASWLASTHGIHLLDLVDEVLRRNPHPHPYKRIKVQSDGTLVFALKSWRVRYRLDGPRVIVTEIASGYSTRALAMATTARRPLHDEKAHREFHRRYPEKR